MECVCLIRACVPLAHKSTQQTAHRKKPANIRIILPHDHSDASCRYITQLLAHSSLASLLHADPRERVILGRRQQAGTPWRLSTSCNDELPDRETVLRGLTDSAAIIRRTATSSHETWSDKPPPREKPVFVTAGWRRSASTIYSARVLLPE